MRVLIVPNTVSPRALGASVELATWCTASGIEPVLESSDAVAAGLDSFAVTAAEIGEPVLAVALGGDGTILKAVHLIGDADVPLLGVKFGRLGFLSGARAESMREAVQAALAGEAAIERRATLLANVVMDGRSVGSYRALNEVVVGRGLTGRVVAFELAIDGHRLMNTHADAMIVATATGSTAYALSAGGPVVAPGFGGMVVVPVAPHTLAARSIVTDPSGTVEITLPDPTRADACITVDGDAKPCRRSIEKVTVSRGIHDVSLVKLDGRDFYETAAAEFFGVDRVLEELHVRDLALIEEAWLEFGPGMTVLTGETGAGKTALLGALKLLLGERADSGAVRGGARETLVEGRFAVEGIELLARRRAGADGRSRCAIDGEMATVAALAERVGPLVDLHGQHEHQALLSASSHLGYLDRWAGTEVERARDLYAAAFSAYKEAVAYHAGLRERLEHASRDADYLRFVSEEIDRVDPQPGEDEQLEARLPALQHAEKLAQAATEAAEALRGEGGAMDSVAGALSSLTRVAGIDPAIDELASQLAEVQALADDAGATARAYRDSVEHDPRALDQVLARLSALGGLKKKYGPTLDEVLARRDEAVLTLAENEDGSAALVQAETRVESARSSLIERAGELDRARQDAAPGFVSALQEATSGLAMEGARFEVSFAELDFDRWTAEGSKRAEFLYAPAPGQAARPLARIASGGELSRVMLALKVVLGRADAVETLVFDEVDSGVGGATATAVGARLAVLGRTHQVIVVTHLAQVAAFASDHLVVTKSVREGAVSTEVTRVSGEERIAEIARMLSGSDSEAGRAHASELLESARGAVATS